MVAATGQWWLDAREPTVEVVASHLINLAWNGLASLDPTPSISPGAAERVALTEDPGSLPARQLRREGTRPRLTTADPRRGDPTAGYGETG